MAVTIQGVSLVSLKMAGASNFIAIKVTIDSENNSVSGTELRNLLTDIVNNHLSGGVFSVAGYFNPYQVSSSQILGPFLGYLGYEPATFGNDNGFKITTTKSEAKVNNLTQPYAVMGAYSGGTLTYKGKAVCNMYVSGWNIPASGTVNTALPILFTDLNNKLYTVPTGKIVPTYGIDVTFNAGFSGRQVTPLPMLNFQSATLLGIETTRINTGSQLGTPTSGDDISDDMINEYPIGGGEDPYDGGGNSGTGGGDGTFDYDSRTGQSIDDFIPPDISATDAGFITLFNPTTAELRQLSDYLWSNAFDLNAYKKLFNDPMDLFLGLSIIPAGIPDGGRKQVGIGLIDTGIYMTVAASQWVKVDCGSPLNAAGNAIAVPNYTGSYMDYDPYTQIELYLPFIGVKTLKADEVMGKMLNVTYWIDILSGACLAWVSVNRVVMYSFMGQCATSIPVASGDWTNIINGVLSVVGGAVGGAVKGGVGGAIAGGVAASSAVAVNDGKISIERSGSISSAGGLLAPQKPYLIISTPRLCKPALQNMFEGYPLYASYYLKYLSGYTEIEVLHLKGIYGTEEELNEIKQLLLAGVIL